MARRRREEGGVNLEQPLWFAAEQIKSIGPDLARTGLERLNIRLSLSGGKDARRQLVY
jgi:hypothetical protein